MSHLGVPATLSPRPALVHPAAATGALSDQGGDVLSRLLSIHISLTLFEWKNFHLLFQILLAGLRIQLTLRQSARRRKV